MSSNVFAVYLLLFASLLRQGLRNVDPCGTFAGHQRTCIQQALLFLLQLVYVAVKLGHILVGESFAPIFNPISKVTFHANPTVN